ncbi:hypothetical protein DFR76_102407 [Nocardia pseudobrasiliensis]|uniref:Uncharacterized protein n=1 Tax=Nocardia pseudobrasiliensis TaxID=45979 RepID=A0A370IBA0_9NOCA|nr:hypothetical protein DFR76_102407 [Nocardia pseudobrasiliensis]
MNDMSSVLRLQIRTDREVEDDAPLGPLSATSVHLCGEAEQLP